MLKAAIDTSNDSLRHWTLRRVKESIKRDRIGKTLFFSFSRTLSPSIEKKTRGTEQKKKTANVINLT